MTCHSQQYFNPCQCVSKDEKVMYENGFDRNFNPGFSLYVQYFNYCPNKLWDRPEILSVALSVNLLWLTPILACLCRINKKALNIRDSWNARTCPPISMDRVHCLQPCILLWWRKHEARRKEAPFWQTILVKHGSIDLRALEWLTEMGPASFC